MTDLTQALAELRQMELTYGQLWTAREVMQTQNADNCKSIATVLNAALSGTMLPRADADLAVALMVEKACHVLDTAGDSAVTEALGQRLCCSGHDCGCRGADVGTYLMHLIRSEVVPASALAELQALRDERDRLDAVTNTLSEMWEGEQTARHSAEAELAALRAQVERLTGALRFYADFHENPNDGPWGINSQDFGKEARTALTEGAAP